MQHKRRVGIIAHVFYDEIWGELLSCINNFIAECGDENVDVYVTYPKSKPQLEHIISREIKAKFYAVPNCGYDVAPFFHVISLMDLNSYDYIVKLHTKRDVDSFINFRLMKGSRWRRSLLAFCSSRKAVRCSLKAFEKDVSLGMIASRELIDPNGCGMDFHEWNAISELLGRCGIRSGGTTLVYGTMFMVRASLLSVVQGKVNISDFPVVSVDNPHDPGLAGLWERAFPVLVTSQGFRVAQGVWPKPLSVLGYSIKSFCFRIFRKVSNFVRGKAGLNDA